VGEVAHLAQLASPGLLVVSAHSGFVLQVEVLVRVASLVVLRGTIVLTSLLVGLGRTVGVRRLRLLSLFAAAFFFWLFLRGLWLRFARAVAPLGGRYLLLLHQVVDLAERHRAFHIGLDVERHQLWLGLGWLAT